MDDNSRSVHNIRLENRNMLYIDGVKDVVSFDDLSVVLNTEKGKLVINGNGLHVQQLLLETGNVIIDGEINELIYVDEIEQKRSGFFGRLLR